MKRIILFCFVMFMAVGVNAQRRAFVCTNNNVAIRKDPGKNYPLAHFVTNDPCKLNKGYVVNTLERNKMVIII